MDTLRSETLLKKISLQSAIVKPLQQEGIGWFMGLRRAFLSHVLRVGFALPSCQLSFYMGVFVDVTQRVEISR